MRIVSRSLRALVIAGSAVYLMGATPQSQPSQFQTRRPIQFHLAENNPAPGLVSAPVKGETRILYLHPEVLLDDRDIRTASAITDEMGRPAVEVHLTAAGVRKFNALIKGHELTPLAIAANNAVISAPIIEGVPLDDDVLAIHGALSADEASSLAKALSMSH